MVTFNDWHSSTAHDCLTSAAKQVKQRKKLNDVFKCVHHERPEYCCLTFGLDILVGNFESYDVNFWYIITNETSLLHMVSPFFFFCIHWSVLTVPFDAHISDCCGWGPNKYHTFFITKLSKFRLLWQKAITRMNSLFTKKQKY